MSILLRRGKKPLRRHKPSNSIHFPLGNQEPQRGFEILIAFPLKSDFVVNIEESPLIVLAKFFVSLLPPDAPVTQH